MSKPSESNRRAYSDVFVFVFGLATGLLCWSLYEHTIMPFACGVIVLCVAAMAWSDS